MYVVCFISRGQVGSEWEGIFELFGVSSVHSNNVEHCDHLLTQQKSGCVL